MLPTLRQVATLAVLVGATLPLTAAASPRAAAPPPLLHPGPVDAWTGATFDRVGGAALVCGLAMVAFLLVAGVAALIVSVRMLLASRPATPPSSTSGWFDHGREQSEVELGGIPGPRRASGSESWMRPTPSR
ncbi:MAG: hypothetical protein J0I34_10345 [Pseudonocardia sp.]|uniref:hypothetical protein n=1 Tax=unclassified Pseudonocardia TaxID=2619320 RepID=UPI00086E4102|nr:MULTISPECIES: hypothetical protein [unclassified Pseudonocardia]MBN9109174.1 hypothetical protein [Pseudonocardia sp.]ODU23185.1 MAG: hypothetical protein ABS80_15735 [Pseudonocardia sp. SCN 72-51]ODV01469.1 MAG: hypothetical protein ABT15_27395 [Pseudonocardia sp. SCN 73-27]